MRRPAISRQIRQIAGYLLIIMILIIMFFMFRSLAGRAFGYVQAPFVQAGTWLYNQSRGLFGRGECSVGRLNELEIERGTWALDQAELQGLRQENEQLREQLSFSQRRHFNIKSAEITSRSVSKQSLAFTINLGQADGLRLGDPVIAGEGNLVGKISALNKYSAVVTGLTDLRMATAISLLNSTRTIGIAKGTIGDLLDLEFIPHDEVINISDLAVTSGLEENVPSGLLVGVVTAVESDQSEPFQKAILEPLLKITNYSTVSVIVPEEMEL